MLNYLTAKAFSCPIETKDGIVINAPSFLSQFNGQTLDKMIEVLSNKPYKFQSITVEDVNEVE